MKFERTEKDYGGGSGKEYYKSDLFRVTYWQMRGGIKTTLEYQGRGDIEISFDGFQEIKTDQDCFEQLTAKEFTEIIELEKQDAFEDGKTYIREEFKRLIQI